MKKQKREYQEVLKEQAVSPLLRSGRCVAEVERELGHQGSYLGGIG